MSAASAQASWLRRLRIDPYLAALVGMVVLASLLPVRGAAATDFALLTKLAIALLFFLHGARLPREAVVAGFTQWRLHLAVMGATFIVFPILGLLLQATPAAILPASLAGGVLFLTCLPSTVQSSIAFTAAARGDVAAAVCAAAASNLLGVLLTPLLVAALMGAHGARVSLAEAQAVVVQLLLPFAAGQVLHRPLSAPLARRPRLAGAVDRGSILMIVYGAFSAAVVGGIWRQVAAIQIVALIGVCAVLLAAILLASRALARLLGFAKEDEIVLVFCGSKKSLASGVPMASILFPPAAVGMLVLPLMVFHQLQLMACAVIAQRYGARPR